MVGPLFKTTSTSNLELSSFSSTPPPPLPPIIETSFSAEVPETSTPKKMPPIPVVGLLLKCFNLENADEIVTQVTDLIHANPNNPEGLRTQLENLLGQTHLAIPHLVGLASRDVEPRPLDEPARFQGAQDTLVQEIVKLFTNKEWHPEAYEVALFREAMGRLSPEEATTLLQAKTSMATQKSDILSQEETAILKQKRREILTKALDRFGPENAAAIEQALRSLAAIERQATPEDRILGPKVAAIDTIVKIITQVEGESSFQRASEKAKAEYSVAKEAYDRAQDLPDSDAFAEKHLNALNAQVSARNELQSCRERITTTYGQIMRLRDQLTAPPTSREALTPEETNTLRTSLAAKAQAAHAILETVLKPLLDFRTTEFCEAFVGKPDPLISSHQRKAPKKLPPSLLLQRTQALRRSTIAHQNSKNAREIPRLPEHRETYERYAKYARAISDPLIAFAIAKIETPFYKKKVDDALAIAGFSPPERETILSSLQDYTHLHHDQGIKRVLTQASNGR